MKNDTKTNLKEMIELIQKQELLLPDFQRGFVWDIEMQQRLVASVRRKLCFRVFSHPFNKNE